MITQITCTTGATPTLKPIEILIDEVSKAENFKPIKDFFGELEKKLKEKESELKTAESDLATKKDTASKETDQNKIPGLEKEKSDLEAKIKGLEDAIVFLKKEQKSFEGKARNVMNSLDEYWVNWKTFDDARKVVVGFQKEVNDLNAELATKTAEVENKQKALNEADQKNNATAAAALKTAEKGQKDVETKLNDEKAKLDKAEKALKAAKDTLNKISPAQTQTPPVTSSWITILTTSAVTLVVTVLMMVGLFMLIDKEGEKDDVEVEEKNTTAAAKKE